MRQSGVVAGDVKVLHIFRDAFPPTYGGIEQHIWDVSRSLAGREFEFAVLASTRGHRRSEQRVDGVAIVRSPEHGRVLSTPVTTAWWREIRDARPAALHVHAPQPTAEAVVTTRRPDIPLVVTVHAHGVRYPALSNAYERLQRRLLARADRIVVGSQVLADTSPSLARHRDRTVVIPYGVDARDSPPDPELVAALRRVHGPIVLYLGRLVAYKGLEVLIEAMRTVDATLLVVGDGPERRRLERVAATVAPRRPVRFVGNVTNDERSAYQQAADVFVLPSVSRAESFGIAMLEAMSRGTPAISTEVGTATSWVNRPGETGLVVPPRDPRALTDAIETLLADDELRLALGSAAALRARRHFSKQAMLDRLAEVYRVAASDRRARTSR